MSAAAVVLEADEPALLALAQVAAHDDVTHKAGAAAFGDRVKHPYSGDRRRVRRRIVLAEKLVAGAYREDDGTSLDCLAERFRFHGETRSRHSHLAILSAVQQDQVKLGKVRNLPDVGLGNDAPDPAPVAPRGDGQQVPPVPGHAEQPRVKVTDADRSRSVVLHVTPPRTAAPSRVVA